MRKIFKPLLTGLFFTLILIIAASLPGCAGGSKKVSFRESDKVKPKTNYGEYSSYEGKYKLAANYYLTISIKDNNLYTQINDYLGKHKLHKKSETQFFLKILDAQIEFNHNGSGEIESLNLIQNGKKTLAKKLKI